MLYFFSITNKRGSNIFWEGGGGWVPKQEVNGIWDSFKIFGWNIVNLDCRLLGNNKMHWSLI